MSADLQYINKIETDRKFKIRRDAVRMQGSKCVPRGWTRKFDVINGVKKKIANCIKWRNHNSEVKKCCSPHQVGGYALLGFNNLKGCGNFIYGQTRNIYVLMR